MAETSRASILLIYTGGTIGMKTNPETGALSPFDFNDIYEEFPYLRMLNVDIRVLHFKPIDSSNVTPALWIELARLIRDSYASFDGFVVLHGTDTMAYSASALSFMIENLGKPVVFTGSQIPIGVLRTDVSVRISDFTCFSSCLARFICSSLCRLAQIPSAS